MKRAAVIDMLVERDRSAADTLAALQRLDDTTTGGITVRRLLDGLAALHGPASEPVAPLVWRRGEAVPEWLVEGARVRILKCLVGHVDGLQGEFLRVQGDDHPRVRLYPGQHPSDTYCSAATALELVAPVPAAADPDDDAAEWKRRALDAEERLGTLEGRVSVAASVHSASPHVRAGEACSLTGSACLMARALRGES